MPIARKPKPALDPDNAAPAVDVDALIAKGGSVGGAAPALVAETQAASTGGAQPSVSAPDTSARREVAFTLRVPKPLLQTLDQHLQNRPFKTPRQGWILEAIVQKLERENAAQSGADDA